MNIGGTRREQKKQEVAAMDVQGGDWKGTNVQRQLRLARTAGEVELRW